MSVVVFAAGNPSRGDDALGPLLMAELEVLALPDVHLVSDFQLQIEHALDLDGRDLALFIDAGTGTPAPYLFREIRPITGQAPNSHALAPEAVLQVYADIRRADPPPAFVLCIRGEEFELGGDLSAAAQEHLLAARTHLQRCMACADASSWRKLVAAGEDLLRVQLQA
jgi:hydrogenase maturation protease